MTVSHHSKVLKQIRTKSVKRQRYEKFNKPIKRKTGLSLRPCRRCGRVGGHVKKYGLNLCRQCFREIATKIGFKKYS